MARRAAAARLESPGFSRLGRAPRHDQIRAPENMPIGDLSAPLRLGGGPRRSGVRIGLSSPKEDGQRKGFAGDRRRGRQLSRTRRRPDGPRSANGPARPRTDLEFPPRRSARLAEGPSGCWVAGNGGALVGNRDDRVIATAHDLHWRRHGGQFLGQLGEFDRIGADVAATPRTDRPCRISGSHLERPPAAARPPWRHRRARGSHQSPSGGRPPCPEPR